MKSDGITRLLAEWQAGDETALERLAPLIYEELRRLARRYMAGERPGHTLQATAVVHEAFARLVGADVAWQDRAHFYSIAARMMRRILVDHAKGRRRQKRGGDPVQVSLEAIGERPGELEPDLLDLDDALRRLAELDPRKAQIIELHYFGGLSHDRTAEVVGVSPVTVHRDLRLAKAWLKSALAEAQ